jgi:hypothetical protein
MVSSSAWNQFPWIAIITLQRGYVYVARVKRTRHLGAEPRASR